MHKFYFFLQFSLLYLNFSFSGYRNKIPPLATTNPFQESGCNSVLVQYQVNRGSYGLCFVHFLFGDLSIYVFLSNISFGRFSYLIFRSIFAIQCTVTYRRIGHGSFFTKYIFLFFSLFSN